MFSDISSNFEKMTLVEFVISDNQKTANIFIKYFDTIVPQLGFKIPKDIILAMNGVEDPVFKALYNGHWHPSILAIKEKYKALIFIF